MRNVPKWSSPTAATSETGRPSRARPWAVIEAEPPITSDAVVEELLDLAEPGDDVAAQHQVGVGVADHEHPSGTGVGRGLLVGGHRPIVADRCAHLSRNKQCRLLFLDRFGRKCHAPAMTTISFVGAGSAEFTRQLLRDLLSYDDLGPLTLVLHDIDERRLRLADDVARLTVDHHGRRAEVRAEADRRTALEGADFVVNTVNVGGHAATLTDFEVPARFGVRQTIADTLGVGGVFRALRTFPVLDALARDIQRGLPRRLAAQLHQPDGDEPAVPRRPPPATSRRWGCATRCTGPCTTCASWSACRWRT